MQRTNQILRILDNLEAAIQNLRTIVNESADQTPLVLPSIESWPEAIHPSMDVSNQGEPAKQFRAAQIVHHALQYAGVRLAGKKVLDAGCGEGHTTKELGLQASRVVGYDIQKHSNWADSGPPKFTDDSSLVQEAAPFDFVLLYDVLDHLENDDPSDFLKWLFSLLAPGGRVFVRTHPWTSRHGSHLYEDGINKAYAHLAFTEQELGVVFRQNLKVVRPIATYDKILTDAGFKISSRKVHSEPVDSFFSGDVLDRIIKMTWDGRVAADAALRIMQIQFVDYCLERSIADQTSR